MFYFIAVGLAAYLLAVLFFLTLFVAAARGDRLWEGFRPGARLPLHRRLVRRKKAWPMRGEGHDVAG